MFKVIEYSLCGIGTADILCAKTELRDLKPKLLCGNGTTECQVAVYFLCGSGTTELPSIIPYVEVELWNFKSLCAEAELQVTEYSSCGISLVRKTWKRRDVGLWVKAILVVLLFTGVGTYWDFVFVFSVIIKQ